MCLGPHRDSKPLGIVQAAKHQKLSLDWRCKGGGSVPTGYFSSHRIGKHPSQIDKCYIKNACAPLPTLHNFHVDSLIIYDMKLGGPYMEWRKHPDGKGPPLKDCSPPWEKWLSGTRWHLGASTLYCQTLGEGNSLVYKLPSLRPSVAAAWADFVRKYLRIYDLRNLMGPVVPEDLGWLSFHERPEGWVWYHTLVNSGPRMLR